MPIFSSPYAQLDLLRAPKDSHPSLQAFNAADEYLLEELHARALPPRSPILLLNDSFGALALSLAAAGYQVTSCGDSYLAAQGLGINQQRNSLQHLSIDFVSQPEQLQGPFAAVLLHVPKTLALLEEQLIRIQPHIDSNSLVVAGAMIKHLPRAAGELLEKHIGPVQASLAKKKARLLWATPSGIRTAQSPYPSRYSIPEYGLQLVNHAGIFSREGLDIGTRAFLPHLPKNLGHKQVADLGCGNGVLALVCAQQNPAAEFILLDEAYSAVRSAQENWHAAFAQRPAQFIVGDGLAAFAANSLDVVLCNPPFHQQQVVGDFLALRMFQQAARCLRPGGELWLVGNRHLGYHVKLKRWFSHVEQIAALPKFVVLRASKAEHA